MAWEHLRVCSLMLPLWILVTAHPEVLDRPECPRSCSCSFTQWFVRCSNASFSSLPADLPHATVELDLQFNQLDSLLAASFPSLPELTALYLGSSRVRLIEPGTFQGVDNLYHLYLDNNLIEEIPAGVFENMTNLVFLHLQHNRITSLSPGTTRLVVSHQWPSLHKVSLHSCLIVSTIWKGCPQNDACRTNINRVNKQKAHYIKLQFLLIRLTERNVT